MQASTDSEQNRKKYEEQRERLKAAYTETAQNDRCAFILYGPKGSGKTRTAATAPGPIWFHSFDPQGTATLRKVYADDIASGRIVIDNSFEKEIVTRGIQLTGAQQWDRWLQTVNQMYRDGVFNCIRTYVLDSLSFVAEALMNKEIQRKKRKDGHPAIQDWLMCQNILKEQLVRLVNLPCYVIVTGHGEIEKDEKEGGLVGSLYTVGKRSKVTIPPVFSEMYYVERTTSGARIHTRPYKAFEAGTRIGADTFAATEEADITKLLEKAGYEWQDKEF